MVALLAILNDIPIMTIAMDNVRIAREPVRWDMRWVLVDASILGLTGVVGSSILLWFALAHLHLAGRTLQTFIFLKLLAAGHLTLYVVRVRDWFWRRPWPSWKLLVALEGTQVLGTLAAVYGWLVAPIGWALTGMIWGFMFACMFLLSAIRVLAFRKIKPRLRREQGGGQGGTRLHVPEPAAAAG